MHHRAIKFLVLIGSLLLSSCDSNGVKKEHGHFLAALQSDEPLVLERIEVTGTGSPDPVEVTNQRDLFVFAKLLQTGTTTEGPPPIQNTEWIYIHVDYNRQRAPSVLVAISEKKLTIGVTPERNPDIFKSVEIDLDEESASGSIVEGFLEMAKGREDFRSDKP